MTQISSAQVQIVNDKESVDGTEQVCHFGFPLDFQFLARAENYNQTKSCRPHLLLQVNSVDSWGRHRIEGYSFVRIPESPGYHKIEVETWRPRGSLYSEVHSFFLGGSIKIHKLTEMVRTKYISEQGQCEIVNRFGMETENSGKVQLTLNVCHQNALIRKINKEKKQMRRQAVALETRN